MSQQSSTEVPPTHNIDPTLHSLIQPLRDCILMKGDSAATNHYIRPQDQACLTDIKNYTGPSVLLPDADAIPPSHQGSLNLHKNLSLEASIGTVLPKLKSSSLLSMGQLCDDNCVVV